MKKYIAVLGLALSGWGLSPAQAAVCGEAAADKPAPAHWRKWFVSDQEVSEDNELLGLYGARVRVTSNLFGQPEVAQGPRMVIKTPWVDLVDWAVYHHTENIAWPTPIVYGEIDDQGRWHVCRIEGRTWQPAFQSSDEETGNFKVLPMAGLMTQWVRQLEYDDRGRVTGERTLAWNAEQRGFREDGSTCLKYSNDGAVIEYATRDAGRCGTAAKPGDLQESYVHDVQGHLVRTITREFRTEEHPSTRAHKTVSHPLVKVYGPDGNLVAMYREDERRRPYRVVTSSRAGGGRDQIDTWVVSAENALQFRWTEHGLPVAATDWQVVVVPHSATDILEHLYGRPAALASGTTDAQGRITMAPGQRHKVWRALHEAGQSVVFTYNSFRTVLLVPQVPDNVFKTCRDPGQTAREACR